MRQIIISALILGGAAAVASAQGNVPEKASYEMMEGRQLWFAGSNAAGLVLRPLSTWNVLSLEGGAEKGAWSLPYDGDSFRSVDFDASGSTRLKKAYLWGSFHFGNAHRDGAKYNAMLYEPSLQMPFTVAGFNESSWRYQDYQLSMKAAVPFGKVAIGFDGEYECKVGAKQVDPRVATYVRFYDLHPSFSWQIGSKDILGVSLKYANRSERGTPTLGNTAENQIVALMRGLGFCTVGTVGGASLRTYVYKNSTYGGALQYNHFSDNADMMLKGSFAYGTTDVIQNPMKPEPMGSVDKMSANVDFTAFFHNNHKVKAGFSYCNSDGIEHVLQYNSSADVQSWSIVSSNNMSSYRTLSANAGYEYYIIRKNKDSYDWKFGADVLWTDEDDSYFSPVATFAASWVEANVHATGNWKVGGKSFVLATLGGGWKSGLAGDYLFTGSVSKSLSAIISDFYPSCASFYGTDCVSGNASVAYSVGIGKKSALSFALDAKYVRPIGADTYRAAAAFTASYLF